MSNDPNENRNPLDPQLGLILTLLRDIPILNAVPSDPPKFPIGFALYDDGVNRRFYIFFNGNWRYVVLT